MYPVKNVTIIILGKRFKFLSELCIVLFHLLVIGADSL